MPPASGSISPTAGIESTAAHREQGRGAVAGSVASPRIRRTAGLAEQIEAPGRRHSRTAAERSLVLERPLGGAESFRLRNQPYASPGPQHSTPETVYFGNSRVISGLRRPDLRRPATRCSTVAHRTAVFARCNGHAGGVPSPASSFRRRAKDGFEWRGRRFSALCSIESN